MDAISFVLGVKGTEIRGNLKELIHRGEKGKQHECYVKLHLTSGKKDALTLSRHIIRQGAASEYRINDEVTSFEGYEARLSDMKINIRARNFLAFQV
jgi:chromosome segregation ATPase